MFSVVFSSWRNKAHTKILIVFKDCMWETENYRNYINFNSKFCLQKNELTGLGKLTDRRLNPLLSRQGCFTGKYTTHKIHTKLHQGPKRYFPYPHWWRYEFYVLLRWYFKHSRECLTTFPNISKFAKINKYSIMSPVLYSFIPQLNYWSIA